MSISKTLEDEYRLRFSKNEAYRTGLWRILCRQFFNQYVSPEMSILDLGCGWGEFINNVDAREKFAMDLNPETARRLSPGIQLFSQDCSRTWPLPAESLDVVFTSNFLEHLPDKAHVEQTLSEARRCLKPNGLIVCMGPNVKYVPGAYWDFWDHFVPLTDLSLSEVLKLKGFRIERCVPRFLPYSMSTGLTPPLFFVQLYLLLQCLWPLLGKQFLVVGRKGHDSATANPPSSTRAP